VGVLLLAGADVGVVDGVDGVAAGLGTVPLAGVDAGVDSGVSGADGTGGPPACTTCTHKSKSCCTSLAQAHWHTSIGIAVDLSLKDCDTAELEELTLIWMEAGLILG